MKRRKTPKRKAVLVRIHEWMYVALMREARRRPIPTSVNRLIVETLLDKYRDIAGMMSGPAGDSAVRQLKGK